MFVWTASLLGMKLQEATWQVWDGHPPVPPPLSLSCLSVNKNPAHGVKQVAARWPLCFSLLLSRGVCGGR